MNSRFVQAWVCNPIRGTMAQQTRTRYSHNRPNPFNGRVCPLTRIIQHATVFLNGSRSYSLTDKASVQWASLDRLTHLICLSCILGSGGLPTLAWCISAEHPLRPPDIKVNDIVYIVLDWVSSSLGGMLFWLYLEFQFVWDKKLEQFFRYNMLEWLRITTAWITRSQLVDKVPLQLLNIHLFLLMKE